MNESVLKDLVIGVISGLIAAMILALFNRFFQWKTGDNNKITNDIYERVQFSVKGSDIALLILILSSIYIGHFYAKTFDSYSEAFFWRSDFLRSTIKFWKLLTAFWTVVIYIYLTNRKKPSDKLLFRIIFSLGFGLFLSLLTDIMFSEINGNTTGLIFITFTFVIWTTITWVYLTDYLIPTKPSTFILITFILSPVLAFYIPGLFLAIIISGISSKDMAATFMIPVTIIGTLAIWAYLYKLQSKKMY